MKNTTIIQFVLAFVLMTLIPGTIFASIPFIGKQGIEVGATAPDFTFQDRKGNWISLSDLRGKKVFIFSWSSWCRCKYQLPALEKFYREHKSDKFEVVAIASDSQGFLWAGIYLDKAEASFISLVDPNNELAKTYNFWATENGFLIDEAGIVRMSKIGFFFNSPDHVSELDNLIKTDFKAVVAPPQKLSVEEKMDAAKKRVSANPRQLDAAFELAELYRMKGDLKKAEETLRAIVGKKPFSAEARWRLGVVIYELGDKEKGVSQWKLSRKLNLMSYIYMRNIQAFYKPEMFYTDITGGCKEKNCKRCGSGEKHK